MAYPSEKKIKHTQNKKNQEPAIIYVEHRPV